MAKPLADVERAQIYELFQQRKLSQREIAKIMHRDRSTIQAVLKALTPTTSLAKAHYEAQALALAQQATDRANVDQILEIHDRTGVLPRVRDHGPAQAFQINIGMPGAPACAAPTQAQIDEAQAKAQALTTRALPASRPGGPLPAPRPGDPGPEDR
jgi:transcriptional regulator with XRE-family HTH domain